MCRDRAGRAGWWAESFRAQTTRTSPAAWSISSPSRLRRRKTSEGDRAAGEFVLELTVRRIDGAGEWKDGSVVRAGVLEKAQLRFSDQRWICDRRNQICIRAQERGANGGSVMIAA